MPKTISGTLHFEIEVDTPDGEEQQQLQEQQQQEHTGLGGIGAAEGPQQD